MAEQQRNPRRWANRRQIGVWSILGDEFHLTGGNQEKDSWAAHGRKVKLFPCPGRYGVRIGLAFEQ